MTLNVQYETLLASTGKFGFYQIFLLIFFQTTVWTICANMTFMIFGGIFPTPCNSTSFNNTSNETVFQENSCMHSFYSVVMEWNLTGSLKHVAAMMTSLQMMGVLIGPLIAGQLSDRFGRKPTCMGFFIGLFIASLSSAFTGSWEVFTILRIFIGTGIGGLLTSMFTLVTECLLPAYRLYTYIGGWPLAYIIFSLEAMVTRHWKYLTIAINITGVLPFLLCFLVSESPKWLMETGKITRASAAFKKISKWNHNSEQGLHELLGSLEKAEELLSVENNKQKTFTYWHLFQNKKLALRSFISAFSWFAISMVFYALLFYSGSLPGDPAINTFIFGFIRVFFSSVVPFIDKKVPSLGRRTLHQIGLLTTGLCVLAVVILVATEVHRAYPFALTVAAMGALCFATCIWMACELTSVELFPTVLRNMANGMCNSVARIGSMIAPQILLLEYFWPSAPMVLLLCVLILSSVLSYFLLPETKNKPLPDMANMEDS